MLRICLTVLICAVLTNAVPHHYNRESLNNRPIIGILSMDVGVIKPLMQYGNYSSHIAASYVKFLESAGARVVPIMINKGPLYYKKITETVNGIFIPGALSYSIEAERGLLDLHGLGYGLAGANLFNFGLLQNKLGNYFPMWGTCLGFQLMTFFAAGISLKSIHIRKRCSSDNQIIPLEFTEDAHKSRLFGEASDEVMQILSKENVTAHFHNYCVTKDTMARYGLHDAWRVLSLNHDFNGMEFVSTLEAKQFPYYASIYHPEKNGFEWVETENTPHGPNAIKMMQHFANFFVNEARKNNNRFPTVAEERAALIYNYTPTYTGDKTVYEQVYFFD